MYSNPFDRTRERLRRLRQHHMCAMDQSLSWEARVWHAGMYEKLTGRRVHVYVSEGVR